MPAGSVAEAAAKDQMKASESEDCGLAVEIRFSGLTGANSDSVETERTAGTSGSIGDRSPVAEDACSICFNKSQRIEGERSMSEQREETGEQVGAPQLACEETRRWPLQSMKEVSIKGGQSNVRKQANNDCHILPRRWQ